MLHNSQPLPCIAQIQDEPHCRQQLLQHFSHVKSMSYLHIYDPSLNQDKGFDATTTWGVQLNSSLLASGENVTNKVSRFVPKKSHKTL